MRSTFVLVAMLLAACSGSSPEKKVDSNPIEQPSDNANAVSADPVSDTESASTPDPAPAALDLDAVEDLETLFEVKGNVSRDQVSGVIGQRKPDVHKCYGDALAASPGMAGRVLVQITTTANGDVASAMVKQTTLKNPAVEQCMTTKMRQWKFPNDDSGGLVIIKYAFQLPP